MVRRQGRCVRAWVTLYVGKDWRSVVSNGIIDATKTCVPLPLPLLALTGEADGRGCVLFDAVAAAVVVLLLGLATLVAVLLPALVVLAPASTAYTAVGAAVGVGAAAAAGAAGMHSRVAAACMEGARACSPIVRTPVPLPALPSIVL